jgi:hypothetical protein
MNKNKINPSNQQKNSLVNEKAIENQTKQHTLTNLPITNRAIELAEDQEKQNQKGVIVAGPENHTKNQKRGVDIVQTTHNPEPILDEVEIDMEDIEGNNENPRATVEKIESSFQTGSKQSNKKSEQ